MLTRVSALCGSSAEIENREKRTNINPLRVISSKSMVYYKATANSNFFRHLLHLFYLNFDFVQLIAHYLLEYVCCCRHRWRRRRRRRFLLLKFQFGWGCFFLARTQTWKNLTLDNNNDNGKACAFSLLAE